VGESSCWQGGGVASDGKGVAEKDYDSGRRSKKGQQFQRFMSNNFVSTTDYAQEQGGEGRDGQVEERTGGQQRGDKDDGAHNADSYLPPRDHLIRNSLLRVRDCDPGRN
jgi:hypothetical protein